MNNGHITESDLYVIYLTERCNLKCEYCYEEATRGNSKMNPETAVKMVDDIIQEVNPSIKAKILLFGGEPLLNWNAVIAALDRLKMYHSSGRLLLCSITTNGTLLKKDKIKKLWGYRDFLHLQISIDGTQETHDKYRKFKSGIGSHQYVVKNCRTTLRYFPTTQARLVVSNPNDMLKDVKYLESLGFRDFCIQAKRNGHSASKEMIDSFENNLQKVLSYLATKNVMKISDIQKPQGKTREMKKEQGHYNYFLPDGGKIKQETYTSEGFQHFEKGEKSSYNILRNKDD